MDYSKLLEIVKTKNSKYLHIGCDYIIWLQPIKGNIFNLITATKNNNKYSMECKRILYKYLSKGINRPMLLYINYKDDKDLSYMDKILQKLKFIQLTKNEFYKVFN